ncbi:MAG: DUF3592 domain-containing protein, partial [Planctomycetota bacterium]
FAGAGFGWFMFGKPAVQMFDARNWPSVPAQVLASGLETNNTSDGTTYRIQIKFEYEYNGQYHIGDTYDFFSYIATSGREGKQRIVDRYPFGSATVCYVDPDNPSFAILSRDWNHSMWFGLIPLVFVIVGAGGIFLSIRGGRGGQSKTRRVPRTKRAASGDDLDWLPKFARPEMDEAMDGSIRSEDENTVTPGKSRWAGALFALVFMAIWDTVVAIAVINMLEDGVADNWGPLLFMIPFVLVGIGCVFVVIYMVLALSNPVVQMTFDPRMIPLGAPLKVDWSINGRAGRIQKLTMTVEGLERATYRRGTDTITDEHVFFEETLFEGEALDRHDPLARDGQAEMQLPANAMHSLDSNNNKIVWRIKVRGDIPRWPDVRDEYEFALVPEGVIDDGPNVRGMF